MVPIWGFWRKFVSPQTAYTQISTLWIIQHSHNLVMHCYLYFNTLYLMIMLLWFDFTTTTHKCPSWSPRTPSAPKQSSQFQQPCYQNQDCCLGQVSLSLSVSHTCTHSKIIYISNLCTNVHFTMDIPFKSLTLPLLSPVSSFCLLRQLYFHCLHIPNLSSPLLVRAFWSQLSFAAPTAGGTAYFRH